MFPLILTGVILSVAGLATTLGVISYRREKKRREGLQSVAEEMGLAFQAADDGATFASLAGFHLFAQGRSKKITNLLSGEANETAVKIFDYRYTIGGGNNSHTIKQTVVSFNTSKLGLPSFSLRPENLFHKIGALFGYQDINFDSYPVFSKHYLLRGSNEDAIRSQFHEGVLSYYEDNPGLCTEGNGPRLVFYRTGKLVKPEDVRAFLEEGFKIAGLFMK